MGNDPKVSCILQGSLLGDACPDGYMERIDNRDWTVGIIGLGYVGLPLAVEFARQGFGVRGVDLDPGKIEHLKSGTSYIMDVPDADILMSLAAGMKVSTDYRVLEGCDSYHIVVPTPLRKSKDPDISYIVGAMERLRPVISWDRSPLVILESTTYPGSTRELIANDLSRDGQRPGTDFFVAFSPERVDPGNTQYNTRNTPKVIGGVSKACTAIATHLYAQVVEKVISVDSPEEAEMVKLLENTFRAVNIGLVNELTLMADRMGINIWNVIEAARTKPFGFMAFFPGPGLGGHCIPLDPMYLSWRAKMYDFYNRFIELATDINGNMPRFVIGKAARVLNDRKKPISGSKILVLGVAYKSDIDDTRESPALEIIKMLEEMGGQVEYSDPNVPVLNLHGRILESVALTPEYLRKLDLAILVTAHRAFDYKLIETSTDRILDCRNGFGAGPSITKL